MQKSAELHEMTSLTFIETPQIGSFGLSFHTSPPLSPLPFAQREAARRLGETLLVNYRVLTLSLCFVFRFAFLVTSASNTILQSDPPLKVASG